MATKTSAVPEMDFTKMWTAFDPSKYMEQFSKMTETADMPKMDVEAIADYQRKNLAAMAAIQRQAFDGAQALASRQAEIVRDGLSEMQAAFEAVSKAPTPSDAALKQVDLAKDTYERLLSRSRELTEMAAKSNTETADLIAARFTEQFDEFKKFAANGTAVAKKATDKAA